MITQRNVSVFQSWISPALSLMFVGSFALGAGLIIWNVAFGQNPLANAMATAIEQRTVLSEN